MPSVAIFHLILQLERDVVYIVASENQYTHSYMKFGPPTPKLLTIIPIHNKYSQSIYYILLYIILAL